MPVRIFKIAFIIVFIGVVLLILGYILRIDRFGMSSISWVDCVQINDSKFHSDFDRVAIDASQIGEKIGEVKFNVSHNVHNPSYHFRNGDATFLDVGTEIYSVNSEDNAVAIKIGTQYFIYTNTY